MTTKKLLTLIILVCSFNSVDAQKRQNVYFYKDDNTEVFCKDSADFIRVIQEPDSGLVHFNLIELYPDGKKKTLGSVSAFHPKLKYEGQLLSYHRNGKRKSTAIYENNTLLGKAYYYFENGSLWRTIELKAPISKNAQLISHSMDTLINYQADSLGHIMVENGNGHLVEQTSAFTGATLEGDYKEGLKYGTWTMKSHSGLYWYKEEYVNGQFISGESEMNGIVSKYTSIDELPTMKGGIQTFYSYLNRRMSYPLDAMRNNIQGKVFLSFFVERNGSLTNIKIERKLYPSLDAEALRVVSASPKWTPGKQHGFPVRVKFNIPISFNLSAPPQRNDDEFMPNTRKF